MNLPNHSFLELRIPSVRATSFGRSIVLQQAATSVPQPGVQEAAVDERPRNAATTAAEMSPGEGWRRFAVVDNALAPVEDPSRAVFAARVIPRNFGIALGLLAHRDGLLVNATPALRFSLLDVKSTIVVPGVDAIFYVAEKIKPYVGAPPAEILGQECPICKIPFDAQTRVGACRCRQFYHFETRESHPQTPDKDRLECFQQTKVCRCGATLMTEEQFTWSADEL